MSNKNHNIYGSSEILKALAAEYKDYCGREVKLEDDRLIVLALPLPKPKKKKVVSRAPREDDEDKPKPRPNTNSGRRN